MRRMKPPDDKEQSSTPPDASPTGAIGPHSPGTDPRFVTGEVSFEGKNDDSAPDQQTGYDTTTAADDEEQARQPGRKG